MTRLACIVLVVFAATSLRAEDAIPLWPNGAPGARADGGELKIRMSEWGDHVISNVHNPAITPYLPAADKATGCGIVICPGGGHVELWSDHEGHTLAQWFADHGVSAFVLYYRLAREPGSTYTVDKDALADVQRAIRMVRSRGDEWHVDPKRLGVMGFSAGGEVAALAAMHGDAGDSTAADPIDKQSSRPDFQALIYPGGIQRFTVAKDAPPVLLLAGYQDRPDISRGLAELYLKYKDAGVPAELHIYASAGHGFGVRANNAGAIAGWPDRVLDWLGDMKMLTAPK
jgi:endo-1,4-beta-xylanase